MCGKMGHRSHLEIINEGTSSSEGPLIHYNSGSEAMLQRWYDLVLKKFFTGEESQVYCSDSEQHFTKTKEKSRGSF